MLRHRLRYGYASTRVYQLVDHAYIYVCVCARALRVWSREFPPCRTHAFARIHPHKRRHNNTPARRQFTSYTARCNRSYKQFNYVYASVITRLSINGITTWRRARDPATGRPRRVIAHTDNKIGRLSCVCV